MSGERIHVIVWRVGCPHRSLLGVFGDVRMALFEAGVSPDEMELRDEHCNAVCDLTKSESVWPASSVGLECWLVFKKRPEARKAKAIIKSIHGVAFGYVGGMIA